MKYLLSLIALLSILPSAVSAASATSTTATSSPLEARALLIDTYLFSAGCPAGNVSCDSLAMTIAQGIASSSASVLATSTAAATSTSPTAPRVVAAPAAPAYGASVSPSSPSASYTAQNSAVVSTPIAAVAATSHTPSVKPLPIPAPTPVKTGNALLQNLPALFVLNALFQHDPSGILTPGGASLGNVIILYQIFFASHLFDL